MGRSTCASASAFNLDAQPAQLDRLVSRIWRPDGGFAGLLMLKIIEPNYGTVVGSGVGTAVGWGGNTLVGAAGPISGSGSK